VPSIAPIPAKDKQAVYVRLAPATYDAIRAAALANSRSMSAEAELRLEASVKREAT